MIGSGPAAIASSTVCGRSTTGTHTTPNGFYDITGFNDAGVIAGRASGGSKPAVWTSSGQTMLTDPYAGADPPRYISTLFGPGTNSQMAATSPAQLANRRAFLERIDQALAQQLQNVDRSRSSVDIERDRLLLASRDKQVLEQLAASYRAQERQVVERRDQREMDDLGGRRARLAATAQESEEA